MKLSCDAGIVAAGSLALDLFAIAERELLIKCTGQQAASVCLSLDLIAGRLHM